MSRFYFPSFSIIDLCSSHGGACPWWSFSHLRRRRLTLLPISVVVGVGLRRGATVVVRWCPFSGSRSIIYNNGGGSVTTVVNVGRHSVVPDVGLSLRRHHEAFAELHPYKRHHHAAFVELRPGREAPPHYLRGITSCCVGTTMNSHLEGLATTSTPDSTNPIASKTDPRAVNKDTKIARLLREARRIFIREIERRYRICRRLRILGFDEDTTVYIKKIHGDIYNAREATIPVEFCEMKKVHLKDLPNLRSFSSGDIVKWSSLENVVLDHCPDIKNFGLGMINVTPHLINGSSRIQRMLALVVDYLAHPRAKCSKCYNVSIPHTQGFVDPHENLTMNWKSFFELNEIVFDSYDDLVCVIYSETLQELRNLKKLVVSHYKELKIIFNIRQEISCSTHLLQQLCELTLIDLPKLTCIVNKDISRFYQNLKLLQVKQYSKALEESSTTNYFFPSSLLVEKLKILYVINMNVEKLWHWNYPSKSFCELENLILTNNNKLLSAISSSMITRFKNLRKLTLNKCELLTEVFDFEDDNLDHKIHEILPQLEVLTLINLIELKRAELAQANPLRLGEGSKEHLETNAGSRLDVYKRQVSPSPLLRLKSLAQARRARSGEPPSPRRGLERTSRNQRGISLSSYNSEPTDHTRYPMHHKQRFYPYKHSTSSKTNQRRLKLEILTSRTWRKV
ncbi:hypothetical protein DEO72_LG3g708 [Vigna unguiculata]|uniref:Disease resistance protein At4g27190-like leucine-rich repeats domain-containing protein n=1 Tax=Vigna unguiculata TaxID=3917 RepID=A0A4D6LCA9_VIGUN|nr:hypothetical protein DEO72_LG3g708 [Vigna unguiculata]